MASYLNIFRISGVILITFSFQFCKKDIVPSLTTLEVYETTPTTATSGGSISDEGSSSISARGVCWSTLAEPNIDDNKTTDSTGIGYYLSYLTGLTPNTIYYVRGYATNTSGTGYGDEISFMTKESGIPVIDSKDVTITWSFGIPHYSSGGIVISDGGYPVTERGICTSTNPLPTILDKKIKSGDGTGSFSCGIYGFSLKIKNYVRAYATNVSGTSYGTEFSFTPPCVPDWDCQLNISLTNYPGIRQSIDPLLTWSYLSLGATGSGPLSADVYLDTVPNPITKVASNLSSASFQVSRLDFSRTYYWKVYAWAPGNLCCAGMSPVKSFTTVSQVTLPSVSTSAFSFSNLSSKIGGSIVSEGGSRVTECGVYLGKAQNPEVTGSKIPIGSGIGAFSKIISGLSANTIYYVKAYAMNDVGTAYGSEISFTTGELMALPLLSDIEGNNYKIVAIGTQVWMAENLKVTKYLDGTAIPNVSDHQAWASSTTGAYCNYDNNTENSNTYGRLYNFYAVTDNRKLCPAGWHVPKYEDYIMLRDYLYNNGHSSEGAGIKIAKSMAASSGWYDSYNQGTVGSDQASNNSSGFSALPGGYRYLSPELSSFSRIGFDGYWWINHIAGISALYITISSSSSSVYDNGFFNRSLGLSVRCIKD